MKRSTPVIELLYTNCPIIEVSADFSVVREAFEATAVCHLPVVQGLRYKGVVLRSHVEEHLEAKAHQGITAADLVSKEVPVLSPDNTIDEAAEIFAGNPLDIIAVVDEEGDLVGLLLRKEVIQARRMSRRGWFHFN